MDKNFFEKNKVAIVIVSCIAIVIIIVGGLAVYISSMGKSRDEKRNENSQQSSQNNNDQNQNNQNSGGDLGNANSTDPVVKGKSLAGGNCSGTGSKKLGSAPMRTDQMSVIIPYGLMAAGHVTPIDHQYYWGKNQFGAADSYDVLSPGDGKLVALQYRDRSSEGQAVKGDYRGVIMYSCTFFSYFDLATSLTPEIQAQLSPNWETRGNINVNINLKEGQVIGKVGGQSLDFAIWDTTKSLPNLIVPTAYNNMEPWKINTVPPLDYFTDEVKAKILPLYANQTLKQDGVIDQDIDGKAKGNWFKVGTNGYAGVFSFSQNSATPYWDGHLSLVNDHVDPTSWVFSKGNINGGEARQFGIKTAAINPANLGMDSGLVKYELIEWRHIDDKGNEWRGGAPANSIKMDQNSRSLGTVVIQMLSSKQLKAEVFLGKTPSQVTGFTTAAETFDRGENARMITSNTAN